MLLVMGGVVLSGPGGGVVAQTDEPGTTTAVPSRGRTDVRELPAPEAWRPGDPMIEGPPRRGTHSRDESAAASKASACGATENAVVE
jgi:hypothetical protein